MKFGRMVLILMAAATLSILAFAQTETGRVTGVVRDPSGAVVPNATVTITSVGKQNTLTTTTSENGSYTFQSLQPGTYEVKSEVQGFTPFTRRVDVTVGGRSTVDVELGGVAGTGTTVEVTAEGGAEVNTTDQTLSQVVNAKQITQLPTLTRNPYDLVNTAGNVQQSESQVRGVGVSINGQRSASTNVLLDGGENNNLFDATVGTTVPLDSVDQFRVLTSNFTAEYGRASGGVVNVSTRSGTNDWHGSLYEFNRISSLAANTYENKATGVDRPRFVRNQFGYSFGGPLMKNKLFFFNSNEWIRVRSFQTVTAMVPAAGLIGASSPATQGYFQSFGTLAPNATVLRTFTKADPDLAVLSGAGPSYAALPAGTAIFQEVSYNVPGDAGGGSPQNSWLQNGRLDFNMTDKTSLFFRYGADHGILFPGSVSNSPYAGYNTGQNSFNQNYLLNLTHIFGPSLVSQTKASYSRLNLVQPLGDAPISPTLYVQETTVGSFAGTQIGFPGYLPFSPGNALPFGGPQNLYQVFQDFSWNHGNHNVRVGGTFIHTRDNRMFGAFQTAVAGLGGQGDLGEALENMLNGQLFSFQAAIDPQGKFPCPVDATGTQQISAGCSVTLPVSAPSFTRNNRYNDWSYYVQDTWKVMPRLTLNLGVRHDYFGVQHNADPRLDSNFYYGPGANRQEQIRNGSVMIAPDSPVGGLWEPDYNNVAPRVGFAWDMFGNGRTSLRGGYGMAFERNFGNVTYNVIQNPPSYAVISLVAGVDVPTIPITSDNAGPLAGSGATVPLPRTSLRHVDQNLSTAYAHTYSAAFEHQLGMNTVMALEYSGSRGIHLYTIENPNRPGSGAIYLGDTPGPGNAFPRLNRQYTNINSRGDRGDSKYDAFNVRFQANNFRSIGLSFTGNYTWSHARDNLSSTFSEASNNFNLGLLDPFNPSLDFGNADFDVRHRVTVSGVWESPFLHNSKGFAAQLLGGWTLAPIFTATTGTPFSIYDCTNAVQVCPRVFTDLTNVALSNDDPGAPVGPNLYNYLDMPTDLAGVYANTALGVSDFGECGIGQGLSGCPFPGNMSRRNSFRGPGHWNLDLGLYKTFRLTERVGLQFRGEAYNLMNHANLFVLGNTADVSGGTAVQAKRGGGNSAAFAPGQDVREHRNIQLGAKITF